MPVGVTRDSPPPREVSDPRVLRALTHPVRLALLEILLLEGPLTATRAGELTGEPVNTCSFHLRQLAKYGFVEEAGAGPGRNRPWRLTSVGVRYGTVSDDPDTRRAARGLEHLLLDRTFTRVQRAFDSRSDYPPEWREVTGASQFILHVSAEELRTVQQEIGVVLERFRDRLEDRSRRPAGSAPVEVLLFSHPVRIEAS